MKISWCVCVGVCMRMHVHTHMRGHRTALGVFLPELSTLIFETSSLISLGFAKLRSWLISAPQILLLNSCVLNLGFTSIRQILNHYTTSLSHLQLFELVSKLSW